MIAPFNVPTILAIRAVAPALALGNAVLLKPDPRTAVSGGAVLAQIFAEAGLPDGVLHVLPGGADVGEALVVERAVRVIAFTGSTRAGRAVGALAAQHLKRVHLELGGNSALLVLDDVDPEAASSVGAWGSFAHQGQVCMTAGRHLVQSGVADAYVDALAARADRLPVGDPTTGTVALGPVIDQRAARQDPRHGDRHASPQGARLAAGGTYEDLYYRPTVLADVPTGSPAYREEIFGPVAPVVRFDTVEEAVALANDSDYGLSLGILTRDVMRGLEIAARIPSGLVHINDQTVNDEATVPFGGVLDCGTGSRQGGAQANLDAFTDTQWVTVRGFAAGLPDVRPVEDRPPLPSTRGRGPASCGVRTGLSPRPRRRSRRPGAAWPPARSAVSALPSTVEEKPHCGDRQSCSSGTYLAGLVDAPLERRPCPPARRAWW